MEILAVSEIPWKSVVEAFTAIALAWIAYKQMLLAAEAKALKVDVQEIHKATNSMKDQLVAATEKEALARGGAQERTRSDLERMHRGETALADVKGELAKLTTVTDAKVDEVGNAVDEVDDKVEEVRDAVAPKAADKES